MKQIDEISELAKECKWEKSKLGRLVNSLIFRLGFSKCRYCIYFKAEGKEDYKSIRESSTLSTGACQWSDKPSATLTEKEIKQFKRCPAFIPVLYNLKGYAIDPTKVYDIRSKRLDIFFKWLGWIVAVLALLIAIFKQ